MPGHRPDRRRPGSPAWCRSGSGPALLPGHSRCSASPVRPAATPNRCCTSAIAAVAVAQRTRSCPAGTAPRREPGSSTVCEGLARPVVGSHPQLGGALVGRLPGEQVVVDLHDDPRAGLDRHTEVGGQHPLATAGCPRTQPRRAVEPRALALHAGAAETGPALPRPGGGPSPRRAATLSGGTRKRITWCTTSGLPGSTLMPVTTDLAVEPGVEQEAAVVVRPRRGRRLGGVCRGHPERDEALALARSGASGGAVRGVLVPVRRRWRAAAGRRALAAAARGRAPVEHAPRRQHDDSPGCQQARAQDHLTSIGRSGCTCRV